LAETNRTPFDFAEGESELVSGYNTEYASRGFALLILAEYTSILLISMFSTLVFFNYQNTIILVFFILLAFTFV
jgi:NADH-ubiquinone oxidoreductase chain 1